MLLITKMMSRVMSKLLKELAAARGDAGFTQDQIAKSAGVARMTVQRIEAQSIDPRLATVEELARALGMELLLVPRVLRVELEHFVQSGGKCLGQPPGVGAPLSIVDELIQR
jgi:DNA-binding XRE family transcriptional regulator